MTTPFDAFAIARKVTDQWLDGSASSNRAAVMQALSAPQDGGKGKSERRLTIGWIAARPDGGRHRLDALPRRYLPNVARADTIQQALGMSTITVPHVIVKLGKAGMRETDFAISFGDQLRIGEAGKGVRLVDLRRVRELVAWFKASGRADAGVVRDAKRNLQARRLWGVDKPVDPSLAAVADTASDDEIRYAVDMFKWAAPGSVDT